MEEVKLNDWFIDLNDGSVIKVIEIDTGQDYPFIVRTPKGEKRVYGIEHFRHEHLKVGNDLSEKLSFAFREELYA